MLNNQNNKKDMINTIIPKNTEFYGDLYLGEKYFTMFPTDVKTIYGSLDISGSGIKELPKCLTITGDLIMINSEIKRLPKDIKVGGSICFSGTSEDIEIPENFEVNDNLDLSFTWTSKLPKGLKVKGDLDLSSTDISIYENIEIGGDVYMYDTIIHNFSKNFKIGGDLILSSSVIKSLPKDIEVKGRICICDDGDVKIPDGIRANKGIYVRIR